MQLDFFGQQFISTAAQHEIQDSGEGFTNRHDATPVERQQEDATIPVERQQERVAGLQQGARSSGALGAGNWELGTGNWKLS